MYTVARLARALELVKEDTNVFIRCTDEKTDEDLLIKVNCIGGDLDKESLTRSTPDQDDLGEFTNVKDYLKCLKSTKQDKKVDVRLDEKLYNIYDVILSDIGLGKNSDKDSIEYEQTAVIIEAERVYENE